MIFFFYDKLDCHESVFIYRGADTAAINTCTPEYPDSILGELEHELDDYDVFEGDEGDIFATWKYWCFYGCEYGCKQSQYKSKSE